MAERLAFWGLGIMGQAMAGNLLKRFPLVVGNRTASRLEPLIAQGAHQASSPQEAAATADLVFLMLKDDAAVEAVVEGPHGVFAGIRPGSVVVDHSTISPAATRRFAARAEMLGVEWCDAPVTGGDVGARDASLTIMVGATPLIYARVTPYLETMGHHIVHAGPVGQGQTAKLVANLVSGLTLMAASEGVGLGLALGVPLEVLETVMTFGSAQSFELSKVLDRLKRADYHPGFSVDNRYKDLSLAVDMAESAGFGADLARAAKPLFGAHREAGYGEWDETHYIKRWEELS